MRIAITGVTGLLGRNVLFELLKQHRRRGGPLEILALGRAQLGLAVTERVHEMCLEDGAAYLGLAGHEQGEFSRYLRTVIAALPLDVAQDDLGLSEDAASSLLSRPLDLVIHSAAVTDLRISQRARAITDNVNRRGTQRFLQFLSGGEVGRLAYVGSAYASHNGNGHARFRNPYEQSKFDAAQWVRPFCRERGWRCTAIRPSIVCGRLLEAPRGATCKFDTFYGFAAFFLREKLRANGDPTGNGNGRNGAPLRIHVHPQAGLNIVPADYAAKVLLDVCQRETMPEELLIVNRSDTPQPDCIHWTFESLGIRHYELVDREPANPSPLERRYYRSVGRTLAPYMTSKSQAFDARSLLATESPPAVECPLIDRPRFMELLAYATSQRFGLRLDCDPATDH